MKSAHVKALLAGCATLAAVGTAAAGGYSRGTADTDLIFEEGNFNMRAGVTIVMPQRGYETLTAPPAGPLRWIDARPIVRKHRRQLHADLCHPERWRSSSTSPDDLRCAGTYTQSFGADSEYGPQAILFGSLADGTGTVSEGFDTNEFGATCGYKFDLAKGRAWLIGGAFLQDFSL